MEMLELATDLKGARAEIIRLREELANIRKENESGLCACEYDSPDDVCMYHSSLVKRLRAENEALREALAHYATDETQDGWIAIAALAAKEDGE